MIWKITALQLIILPATGDGPESQKILAWENRTVSIHGMFQPHAYHH